MKSKNAKKGSKNGKVKRNVPNNEKSPQEAFKGRNHQ